MGFTTHGDSTPVSYGAPPLPTFLLALGLDFKAERLFRKTLAVGAFSSRDRLSLRSQIRFRYRVSDEFNAQPHAGRRQHLQRPAELARKGLHDACSKRIAIATRPWPPPILRARRPASSIEGDRLAV